MRFIRCPFHAAISCSLSCCMASGYGLPTAMIGCCYHASAGSSKKAGKKPQTPAEVAEHKRQKMLKEQRMLGL